VAALFLNGMALIGLLFGRIFQRLPGRGGAAKGLSFGVIGWLLLNLAFFPLIDLGPFAIRVGAGIAPALLSLGMLLTYSIVLGILCRARSRIQKPSASNCATFRQGILRAQLASRSLTAPARSTETSCDTPRSAMVTP
jgi:hypothetical protein